jgi:hypothetical protein
VKNDEFGMKNTKLSISDEEIVVLFGNEAAEDEIPECL